MQRERRNAIGLIAACALWTRATASFAQNSGTLDASCAAWDGLLKKHVRWLPDNRQSRVDYRGFAADRAVLQKILAAWSALTPAAFAQLSSEKQMAFLINAYNAFTVELILTRYPQLTSIKELGSLLQSPWKNRFVTLLGEPRHLDWIEHEQLRPRYRDPRVHSALNCASIGCPALRPEAFTAGKLDSQLDDGMLRFMADRSRNRYADGRLQISMIFKWYRQDFESGQRGFNKLEDLTARYADPLADTPADRDRIRAGGVPISFLEYDWALNAAGR